jgi:serine/threonine protein phosphatase PrpC
MLWYSHIVLHCTLPQLFMSAPHSSFTCKHFNLSWQGKKLVVANVGDSRAVLAERTADGLTAIDLTQDQTPYRCLPPLSAVLCGVDRM